MAMAKLVAGECGRMNPLMELASRFHEGNSRQAEFSSTHQESYSFVPQTFDMQLLLNEMHRIERPSNMAVIDSIKQNHERIGEKLSDEWKTEYFQRELNFIDSFESLQKSFKPQTSIPTFKSAIHLPMHRYGLSYHDPTMNVQHVKWATEYLDEVGNVLEKRFLEDDRTAHQILKTIEDEVSSEADQANEWVHEYVTNDNDPATLIEEITQESADAGNDEYWNKLQEDWKELFSQEQFQNEEELFLNTYSAEGKEYPFETKNPFAGVNNSFEEGLKKLNEGDLISAILLFEEAVQVNPNHGEAWQYLGTSQAENEQELLAICALKKCLDIHPDNLEARMALAVSYTNESMQTQINGSMKQDRNVVLLAKQNPKIISTNIKEDLNLMAEIKKTFDTIKPEKPLD